MVDHSTKDTTTKAPTCLYRGFTSNEQTQWSNQEGQQKQPGSRTDEGGIERPASPNCDTVYHPAKHPSRPPHTTTNFVFSRFHTAHPQTPYALTTFAIDTSATASSWLRKNTLSFNHVILLDMPLSFSMKSRRLCEHAPMCSIGSSKCSPVLSCKALPTKYNKMLQGIGMCSLCHAHLSLLEWLRCRLSFLTPWRTKRSSRVLLVC